MLDPKEKREIKYRYGKPMDMRGLNRDTEWRKEISTRQRRIAEAAWETREGPKSHCPICASTKFNPFLEVYGFTYVECEKCTHLFSLHLPSEKFIQQMYSGRGENLAVQDMVYMDPAKFELRSQKIAQPKVEWITSVLPRKQGLWVDIGCGPGEALNAAQRLGWKATGYELDINEVKFAKERGLDARNVEITSANAKSHLSDAEMVSFINVVEHVREPKEFLEIFSGAVSPGRFVAIEVPRHPALSTFVNLVQPHRTYRHFSIPMHLHVFTEKSMFHLLEECGFLPRAVWRFGQDFQELISGFSNEVGQLHHPFVQKILDVSNEMQGKLDEMGMCDVMLVVAEKTK